MTFQPVIPSGGVAGWAFLSRTREAQQQTFERSPAIQRDTDYFEQKIGKITRPEDLVADRRLLRVALGAFGLDSDIDSRFFIRKVLEGGTFDPKSLANRLSDKRYLEMAKAFGFTDMKPPHTVRSDFGAKITAAYRERQFEVAVGNSSADLRIAMSLDRDLGAIATKKMSEDARWFMVMANPPLRTAFERVFSLPPATGALDIDRQLQIFKEKSRQVFGSSDIVQFADPDRLDDLRRKFLIRSELQAATGPTTRGSVALSLLQSMPRLAPPPIG